jgi:outer membrane receptor protein involved in Fe transport
MQHISRATLALIGVWIALAPVTALADGTVSGVVIDGLTGQPVRGATIAVEGAEVSITSDLGGAFRGAAPAGTYTVLVSKDGFDSQRVADVVVADGEVADFAVVLLPSSGAATFDESPSPDETEPAAGAETSASPAFAGEITVTADPETSTEIALLSERKNAAQISDAIGSDEMKKNGGGDAADVVKRVVGISLEGDKYVFVRGLGDRYSNTSLNGSKIPSTEFDKKVVPLDLYPAALLDTIKVSKSYTVDKPGDFAAGLVEMETLDFPGSQTASLGFSTGSHSETSGDSFGQYAGGLSFGGNGGQPLPDLPSDSLTRLNPLTGEGFTPQELQEIGLRVLEAGPVWTANGGAARFPFAGSASSAPYDTGYSGSYGNTFGRLGMVVSGTYGHDYQARLENQNFYRYSTSSEGNQFLADSYQFDTDTESVKSGMTANLAYRISDNHHLKFRSILSNLSTAETRLQSGVSSDFGADIRDYKVEYKDQQTQTLQLAGEHFFDYGALGGLLEWRGATSRATTNQDLRFSLYLDRTGNDNFVLTDNAQSLFIYSNDLEDTIDDFAADWTSFLSGDTYFGSLKVGAAYTHNVRDFAGRRLRFRPRSAAGIDLTAAPEDVLTPDNIRPDGYEIEEITRPTDFYEGDHAVAAAYAQLDWTYDRWRVIGGVRFEASDIEVITQDRQNASEPPISSVIEDRDWLPALSVVYKLSDDQNLRLSGSQTVNRPEFRELAPFRFKPIAAGQEQTGNPDLVSATIDSLDARWEWFPSPSDVVAFSLFYKTFTNPIEAVQVSGAALTETYQNADSARNQGLELELRRGLGSLTPALDAFTVILNYSWIDSEISLTDNTIQTNLDRPLVGQPDNVGNLVVEWLEPQLGATVRLLYNYTGEKVAFAGTNGLADVVEDPRGTVDLVYRQGFKLWDVDWTVKLAGNNLTNERREFSQGGGLWRGWDPGRTVGLSLSLNFF